MSLNKYLFQIVEKIFFTRHKYQSKNFYSYLDDAYRMVILYVFLIIAVLSFFIFSFVSFLFLQKINIAIFQVTSFSFYLVLLYVLHKGMSYRYISTITALLTAVASLVYAFLEHGSYDVLLWTIIVIYNFVFFMQSKYLTMSVLVYYAAFLAIGVYGVYHWQASSWNFVLLFYFSMVFFTLFAFISFHQYVVEYWQKKLIVLSETDSLTEMHNRRKIENILESKFFQSIKENTPLAVCLLDIDNFKKINDSFGHFIGDDVLVEFSSLLKENLPAATLIGRWGGEEFLWVLPGYSFSDAKEAVSLMKKNINRHKFSIVGKLTCSCGVSISDNPDNNSMEVFFREADKAMYQAKRRGKNRIVTVKV